MGCFSSVCIVSKLPIYRHPVVGIPIKRISSNVSIKCYPSSDWEIHGFPFFGINNCYGAIEDYEDGKYFSLNKKRFGKAICEKDEHGSLIDLWCQPEGDDSIMFIHRPIWDKIQEEHREHAIQLYDDANEQCRFRHFKIPSFLEGQTGLSSDFYLWCNMNYKAGVKEGIIDLIALGISSFHTHTIYMPTYTVGEQISDWKYEAKWHRFIAVFATETRKERA